MIDEGTKNYIRNRTLPKALDVEVAKRAILEHVVDLSRSQRGEPINGDQLVRYISIQTGLFSPVDPVTAGLDFLEEQIRTVRSIITAREALILLNSDGVLVAYGGFIQPQGGSPKGVDIHPVRVEQNGYNSTYNVDLPSIHRYYRLATKYQEDQRYLFASDAIYIAHLDQGSLPARAKRCLSECIRAYQVGLYLSATMSIGAASESLWMSLCRLVYAKKPTASNQLANHLKKTAPSMTSVIKDTWQVIVSQYKDVLDATISSFDQISFKEQADRLCYRRNYAMHNDKADVDEPLFDYDATGRLLIDSIRYFNQFMKLIEAITVMP